MEKRSCKINLKKWGVEVLIEVIMECSVFWDITPVSPDVLVYHVASFFRVEE
jgi:hypothetical protein